jgi:hypothetical protein
MQTHLQRVPVKQTTYILRVGSLLHSVCSGCAGYQSSMLCALCCLTDSLMSESTNVVGLVGNDVCGAERRKRCDVVEALTSTRSASFTLSRQQCSTYTCTYAYNQVCKRYHSQVSASALH